MLLIPRMPESLELLRRSFAERLRATCNLGNRVLVDALAAVPRERFLPPGPWLVRGEGDREVRQTPSAAPEHLYDDVSVAIDSTHQLFNAAPGAVAPWIDALEIAPGGRVLQIGCGLGYYTAVLAHCVGPTGRVVAFDADPGLANSARGNLAAYEWVEIRNGHGRAIERERYDAILVHAGVTHPEPLWLDALGTDGRMVLPLTCTFPQLGPLGKGFALLISATDSDASLSVRVCIVSESLARALAPDGNVLGRSVTMRTMPVDLECVVIGTAADATQGDPRNTHPRVVYRPALQLQSSSTFARHVLVQTTDPDVLAAAVPQILQSGG